MQIIVDVEKPNDGKNHGCYSWPLIHYEDVAVNVGTWVHYLSQ